MRDIIVLCLLALIAGASACTCKSMKWANCEENPCTCTLLVGNAVKQQINCDQLIPKCFLMKAEMYRARNNLSTRSFGGKPVETAFVDNDGIYDPDCESDGRFKAIQCNNTETCWCVNSAGVRRTDKADKNMKCEPVETYGIENAFLSRYSFNKSFVDKVEYNPTGRLIVVDLKKPIGDRTVDLPRLSYYLEKDVKILPLFKEQNGFSVGVNGNPVEMENILVYYVDEKAPTFTMSKLTGGVIAVIVVVILILLIGLLILFFAKRKEQAKYSKAQPREMETMS